MKGGLEGKRLAREEHEQETMYERKQTGRGKREAKRS
jgi:hypothetical protein